MIGSLPADQMMEVARWVLWLWVVGFLAQPITTVLLPDLKYSAAIAAKLLGWSIVGFAPWFLASFGLISFARSAPVVGILVLTLTFSFLRSRIRVNWWQMLTTEVFFFTLFWLGLAARLALPDLTGLEKFTDLGFMQAVLRSDVMPPEDIWFAGETVNYYYFGHAMAAFWALLTGISADHAYQLHMATLFGLTGLAVFGLTAELLYKHRARMALLLGGFATLLALYAGNFHSFLYQVLRNWVPATKSDFHYPDSTRFIGFDPDSNDKAFTEFTAYGFKVGDMHAHLLATPLYLLALLVILSIFRRAWDGVIPKPPVILLGWMLGIFYMTNAWDVLNVGLVVFLTFILLLTRGPGKFFKRLDHLLALGLIAAITAFATAAPFIATFVPFAKGVEFVNANTPVWQLVVIYGHGLFPLTALLIFLTKNKNLKVEPVFAGILALVVAISIILPEVVIVRDIYGEDYARANTMFKLSFRSQTLIQIASMVAIGYIATKSRRSGFLAFLLAVPLILTFSYAEHTLVSPRAIQNLNGLAFLGAERELISELSALPLSHGETVVEAVGESFTKAARVSTITGMPTILGWPGHEQLWRNDYLAVGIRRAAVEEIYSGPDPDIRCNLISRFRVRYVVVGQFEYSLYPELDAVALSELGSKIIETDAGYVIMVNDKGCGE